MTLNRKEMFAIACFDTIVGARKENERYGFQLETMTLGGNYKLAYLSSLDYTSKEEAISAGNEYLRELKEMDFSQELSNLKAATEFLRNFRKVDRY